MSPEKDAECEDCLNRLFQMKSGNYAGLNRGKGIKKMQKVQYMMIAAYQYFGISFG